MGGAVTPELLINENTSATLGAGFGRYYSTHGSISRVDDVFPLKLGVKKYLTDFAPEGFFIHLQSGILYYKVKGGKPKEDISPFAGISLGWMNGTRLVPSFGYSLNQFFDYWHQYVSFKLSATF